MSDITELDVYIDYLCPYAHHTSAWLRAVRSELGGKLTINWRFFPIEQVNSTKGPDWKVWEQSIDHRTRGWDGFRGAVAAVQQGDDAFERFHFDWFAALHDTPVGVKRPTVFEVAERAGLDMARFEQDFVDRSLWTRVRDDYEHGVQNVGVFGSPTIVFADGSAAYVQIRPAPPESDTMSFWEDFVATVVNRPYVKEIKRPVKPD